MERKFYNEEFEYFLKQKSDQYKMYPSDKVWNNIYSSLHKTRRWVGLMLLVLLIGAGLFISRQMLMQQFNQMAGTMVQPLPQQPGTAYSNEDFNTNHFIISSLKTNNHKQLISPRNYILDDFTKAQAQQIKSSIQIENKKTLAAENALPVLAPETSEPAITDKEAPDFLKGKPTEFNVNRAVFDVTEKKPVPAISTLLITDKKEEAPLIKNNYTGTIGIKVLPKWGWQFYASPIVSYRRLNNVNQSQKYTPVAINYAGNIDGYVHHTPGVGFEFGGKLMYRFSDNLRLFAGAQLNYSRYYIDAYNYHTEIATIALNTPVADTIANYTSIRNFQGYSPEQLQNRYLQISVPLGAELKLLGSKRLQLNIAASVQPTYLLSNNSYLISSDYKNYIQNSNLVRKFNLHTNLETFVSYKMGGIRWQLGPQFRYQVLSSYSNKYPIREYLTEFGIKLGITKQIW
jgi:hypothetical protein